MITSTNTFVNLKSYNLAKPHCGAAGSLAASAEESRRLQAETEAELAAFTPALLAKAFRGEL